MMKQFFALLFFGLSSIWIVGQDTEGPVILSGTILDAESRNPLAGVHIICLGKAGTTTDLDGKFTIHLLEGDTVQITHVGYIDNLVLVPQSTQDQLNLTIGLTPSLTELDEVVIYQWPATLSGFKQRILAMAVEEKDRVIIPGSYQGPPKPVNPGFGSPISFIQSKLSKKIRRRREFLKKRQDLESSKPARARYNQDYVQEITGIEDKKVLEDFMVYCKFTNLFLADVNDYDLIVAINQCYSDFKTDRLE
jgi:hypothetical protein